MYTNSWYGHAGVLYDLMLCGFRCAFSCMFQYSLCHGMDIGICDIVHWSAAPHNHIANRTVFSVYVVLVYNVIRYSCHYFLDRILFHRDFHHGSCDYHRDFYGLLYVMFTFPTRIVYRGVPDFATDCPCGVWCRGSTTCMLVHFLEI